jgi:hypothetical protein
MQHLTRAFVSASRGDRRSRRARYAATRNRPAVSNATARLASAISSDVYFARHSRSRVAQCSTLAIRDTRDGDSRA